MLNGDYQVRFRRVSIIQLILLVCVLELWLLTIATAQVHEFPPDPFYYAKELPIYYWIGMVIACVLLVSSFLTDSIMKRWLPQLILVSLFILYLSGTPSFIYDNARYSDSFNIADYVDKLEETHHVSLTGEKRFYDQSYPFSIIACAMAGNTIGISGMTIDKYFPIFAVLLISIAIYTISRKISAKYAILAPVSFLGVVWMTGYHMAPQNYALMIYPVVFLILFKEILDGYKSMALSIIAILVLSAIALTHPATPIIVSICILLLYLIFTAYKKMVPKSKLQQANLLGIFLVSVLLWLSYDLFVARGHFSFMFNMLHRALLNLLVEAPLTLIISSPNPVPAQQIADNLRKGVTIGMMLVSILCFMSLWTKETKMSKVLFLFLGGWFLGASTFHLYSMISGGIYFGRVLMFLFAPFSLLVPVLFFIKSKYCKVETLSPRWNVAFKVLQVLVIGFVIVAVLLIPITRYAVDVYEFWPNSTFAAEKFYSTYFYDIPTGNFGSAPNVSNTFKYNYIEVREQSGHKYLAQFDGLSAIYTSGQSTIYIK